MEGLTAACGKEIPPFSILWIKGVGVRQCQDVGGKVNGFHVDVFFDKHSDARRVAKVRREVRVLRWGRGKR